MPMHGAGKQVNMAPDDAGGSLEEHNAIHFEGEEILEKPKPLVSKKVVKIPKS